MKSIAFIATLGLSVFLAASFSAADDDNHKAHINMMDRVINDDYDAHHTSVKK